MPIGLFTWGLVVLVRECLATLIEMIDRLTSSRIRARRILGVYGALGSGPFQLIRAVFGRLIDKTRRAPEPIRRMLWGQRR